MGYRHSPEEILDAAVATVHADGLHQLTFGRVAKRLGINDRTIVYYFPTKADLVAAVLARVGEALQGVLAEAFQGPVDSHTELLRQAWPVLAAPEADPTFALFFQAVGLATAGQDPYVEVIEQVVFAWREWLLEFLTGPEAQRRAEAAAAMGVLDGLLLLRQTLGAEAAGAAAARLGITD